MVVSLAGEWLSPASAVDYSKPQQLFTRRLWMARAAMLRVCVWWVLLVKTALLQLCLWGVQLVLWLLDVVYHFLSLVVIWMLGCSLGVIQAGRNLVLGMVCWVLSAAAVGVLPRGVECMARRLRDLGRRTQDEGERRKVGELARVFVQSSGGRYEQLKPLQDLGSRLQKMWYQVTGVDGAAKILSLTPMSSNCALKLDEKGLKTLNGLLRAVQHPLLQTTEEIAYLPKSGYFVTVQPLVARGSLKDVIYQARPLSDWSVKYAQYSKTVLSIDMIASYGRQILEATLHLYRLGLVPLGHIQTGNVFVEGEVCRLGGYETRLLGYKTRLYNLCATSNCSEDIDIIMFGCLVFEMVCGYELTELVPGHHDYQAIKHQELRELVEFIFRRNKKGRFLSTMGEILALEFFQDARLPSIDEVWPEEVPLTRDMRQLIGKVVRGVAPQKVPAKRKQKRDCCVQ